MNLDGPPKDQSPSPLWRYAVLFALILAAGICRWLPHPMNFTPIGAMALFGGATYPTRRLAFLLPLSALAVGDLATGFHVLMPVVYLSFAVNVLLGRYLRQRRIVANIVLATIAGATQFFIVTNLATWWVYYPHTSAGLVGCFVAAIPCFQNTLAGDATFVGLLFGGLALTEARFPAIRETSLQPAML